MQKQYNKYDTIKKSFVTDTKYLCRANHTRHTETYNKSYYTT